ncbi:coiled-coil domain-containing protein 191 [Discoglossus pictus]
MLMGSRDMARPGNSRPELYRWKRMSKKSSSKPVFDYDNVEHWIKHNPRHRAPALDLESADQLYDHDDAYNEAQDLLSEWMNTKLKLELISEDEEEPGKASAEITAPNPPDFVKYNRFDDLYNYLEQETENSTAQEFLQELLQKEVVSSGILEDLRSDKDSKAKKQRDPRLTMELRHQQVKENRAKRQKELEKQRQERTLKKCALSQARVLVQEEHKKKALQDKKEEEEIQREMVKLRKEMSERRKIMEEARKMEWKRQEMENASKPPERIPPQSGSQKEVNEKRKLEKQAKIKEMLSQLYAENHKCLQKYFSAWYKLVLDRRVKMGKARALADWKHQLRVFRAWRDQVWARKLDRETNKLEMELRDQNRKQQLASESYRKRLLRHCLVEWQLWARANKERRELEERKEETKRKMAALLDAASLLGVSKGNGEDHRDTNMGSPANKDQQMEGSSAPETPAKATPVQPPKVLKHAWQVTRQHAALSAEELVDQRLQPPTDLHQPATQRKAPPYGEKFENRHTFQQQMIEEQRRQLQEQKEVIMGLMENQRLIITKQEADRATAVTAALNSQGPPSRQTHRRGSDVGAAAKQAGTLSSPSVASDRRLSSPSQSCLSTARTLGTPSTHHPVIKAMEERAAQRTERKRELEEMKRKREEEKLAQLKAEEEDRLQKLAAEREAQLERKREEKRLQKQKELEKQMRLQRQQELEEKARGHYRKILLRSWGLRPWKRLMVQSRQDMERAEKHYSLVNQRRCLLGWRQAVQDVLNEKNSRAEELWCRILLRRSFQHWVKYKDYLSIQDERVSRRYKSALQRKIFLAWLDLAQEEKIALWEKQRIAAEHNQRRILLTAFRIWKQFPQYMKDLKLKEERREMLRKKVAEMLPDFRM